MKSRSHFNFRQFSVGDDQCSMKVGTDAVLLAAWADLHRATRVLDIGTGSGVIALIAAQRTGSNCLIDGVEIQESDCTQAAANVVASPWADRIRIVQSAIQDFAPPYQYDVILCNPPFFVNSLLPPNAGRSTARHTISLTHDALISTLHRLLAPGGKASFILPYQEGRQFKHQMEESKFWTHRACLFRTRRGKQVERILLSFERRGTINEPAQEEELLLYGEDNQWTPAYMKFTEEFYLPRKR